MSFIKGSQAEPHLREFETKVLDIYHESMPFWARPGEAATVGILMAYDSLHLPLMEIAPGLGSPDGVTRVKYIEEGLAQALRWLLARHGHLSITPVEDRSVVSDAGDFLGHATRYACIADLHRSFGHDQLSVSVDPQRRIVRFEGPRSVEGWMNAAGQHEAFERVSTAKPIRRLHNLSGLRSRIREQTLSLGPGIVSSCIRLGKPSRLNDEAFFELSDLMSDAEPIEVGGKADLVGFSMQEFDRFWSAMLRWSAASLMLYMLAPDPSIVYPTQMVRRADFELQMTALTRLSSDVVRKITGRLSLAQSIKAPDCFLQPLVASQDSIAWSPRVVLSCRHQRNMLKLMAKTPKLKTVADNLIGEGEARMLKEIRERLAKRGYQLKLNALVQHGRDEGEIDILAWTNRAPEQVLIIEAKAVLPADEIGEVADLTKKVIAGQGQLRGAIEILTALQLERKRQLFKFVRWEGVKGFLGFVITSEGYPTSEYDYSEFPVTDLRHFRSLRPRDLKTPNRIVEVLRERPWFRDLATLTKEHHESIHIGDVEYQIPLLVEEA